MPLCIFSGVIACNKSFYIRFAFLRHEDIDSYRWVISQVQELYTRVGQADGPEVVLTDKEDALIAGLQEVMSRSHLMLCIWYINKNVLRRATKYFPTSEEVKAWMDLWYKVCQALTLAEYEQARGELQVADLPRIPDHRNSLFEYVDKEYLSNSNNQKHCYYWTNRITHFNKRFTSTAEGVMLISKERSKVLWVICLKWWLQSRRRLKISSGKFTFNIPRIKMETLRLP